MALHLCRRRAGRGNYHRRDRRHPRSAKRSRFTVEEAALWEPLRGYAGTLGSVTMKDGTDVELNGYGAARLSHPHHH